MNKRILDFGCGTGYRAPVLGRKGNYVGVDISADNIDRARRDFPAYEWFLIDGMKLPFSDGSFDEIHAYDVLEHVSDPEQVFSEIVRCLKKRGSFIIEVPAKRSEKLLLKIHSSYWDESGHRRIVDDDGVKGLCDRYGFHIRKASLKRGIDNLVLIYYFLSGRSIIKDTGDIAGENKILKRLAYLFSEDFFSTQFFRRLEVFWLLFPIWVLTQPLGRILSMIFPKTVRYELVKT